MSAPAGGLLRYTRNDVSNCCHCEGEIPPRRESNLLLSDGLFLSVMRRIIPFGHEKSCFAALAMTVKELASSFLPKTHVQVCLMIRPLF